MLSERSEIVFTKPRADADRRATNGVSSDNPSRRLDEIVEQRATNSTFEAEPGLNSLVVASPECKGLSDLGPLSTLSYNRLLRIARWSDVFRAIHGGWGMKVLLAFTRFWVSLVVALLPVAAIAAPLVPGSGQKIEGIGDDFEDEKFSYTYSLPKASKEIDEQVRTPGGRSKNGRWMEGALRGTPDHVRRIETPADGLEGSTGSMLIQTLNSGVPGNSSFKAQQDDLLANPSALRGSASVAWSPSVVTRVFVPSFDKFERRTGVSFGFRAAVRGYGGPKNPGELDDYWPGIFIRFVPKSAKPDSVDTARFMIRAGTNGADFWGPDIKETGWYTLGMSFTPDGAVHYYIKKGVDNLTSADYIASRHPYGFDAKYVQTFFFNVLSADDGKTWSTPWIVDDPSMYWHRPQSGSNSNSRR